MEEGKGVAIDEGGRSSKKQEELLAIKKLRKGISVGKRGGPFTPVPSWKLERGPSQPSTRQLGASLWEVQDLLPLSKMRHRRKKLEPNFANHSEPSSPLQPQSAARLMRHVRASFDQHHKLIERSTGEPKPESPASYSSSVEVAAFNRSLTPSSSFDLKGRLGESGYSIKTSAELLKIFNRIWRLEEQHASNVSLVKTLKVELHHSHSRIQELIHDRQAYHQEMDDLMKRVSEDRLTRKNKLQGRIKAAIESIKNELEDEKKMRRCSESLYRRFSKELSEVHSALKKSLNDLESERKARALLEDLCDAFAKGVEYEQEMQDLKQRSEKDSNHRLDLSVHHISKVWMDERQQMKIAEVRGEEAEKNTILDRLTVEITSFLQTRRPYSSRKSDEHPRDGKDCSLRRHSVESVHFNGVLSAPQDAEDADSVTSDLHFFDLNMDVKDNESKSHSKLHGEEGIGRPEKTKKSNITNAKLKHSEKIKGRDMSSLKQDRHLGGLRGNYSQPDIEGCQVHPENICTDSCNHSSMRNHIVTFVEGSASGSGDLHNLATLVPQWNYRHASSDPEISKCSAKLPRSVKENSLKEKLLEARLEGLHARLKALKGTVGGLQK